jgi:Asp-tRNA(Asn)/Glu-tRNA(Gln) amidotransferase A subunit family amidase
MTDLHRLSIRELSEGLKQAQFSSRELTEHYLKRIAKLTQSKKLCNRDSRTSACTSRCCRCCT